MVKEKRSGIHIGEGERRKRMKGVDESVRRVQTRASSEKKRRLDKNQDKRKGKRVIRYVYIESDSDSESDVEYRRRRRSKYNTSESEESDSESFIVRQKRSHKGKEVIKPTNCFGGVHVDTSQTYYRSNLRSVIKDLKGLEFSEQQLSEIRKTPFWFLFNSIYRNVDALLSKHCKKFEKDIMEIVKRFDFETESFVIGGKRVTLSKQDAELIFGISSGTEKISLRLDEYEHPVWVRRCFLEEFRTRPQLMQSLYKPQLLAKIRELSQQPNTESIKDVARLTCCYLMAAVMCPVRSGAVPWHLTYYLEEFSDICKYDWSTYVVDHLKSQLKRSKQMKAGGCAMMLPYWLCEHTRLVEPIKATAFPRFLKWNTEALNKVISRGKLHQFTKVSTEELKPTTDEKEQLISLRKIRCSEHSACAKNIDTNVINSKDGKEANDKSNEADMPRTRSNATEKQNVVFQQSSSKRFEVGSSSNANQSLIIDCPSFDIGFDTDSTVGGNIHEINRDSTNGVNDGKATFVQVSRNKEKSNVEGINLKTTSGVENLEGKKIEDLLIEVISRLQKVMEEDRIRFQSELKEKDDMILKLKNENEKLVKDLAIQSEQTKMGIFEIADPEINGTPVAIAPKRIFFPEHSSLAPRVKGRTRADDMESGCPCAGLMKPPVNQGVEAVSDESKSRLVVVCAGVEAVSDESKSTETKKRSLEESSSTRVTKYKGFTQNSDTVEAAIMDMEEYINKVKWLKKVLHSGNETSSSPEPVPPQWEFVHEKNPKS